MLHIVINISWYFAHWLWCHLEKIIIEVAGIDFDLIDINEIDEMVEKKKCNRNKKAPNLMIKVHC